MTKANKSFTDSRMKTRFAFCFVLRIGACVTVYEDIPVMSPFEEEYIHT